MQIDPLTSTAFVVRDAFTADEIEAWQARVAGLEFEEGAPINGIDGFVQNLEIRDNARAMADRPEWAAELWDKTKHIFWPLETRAPIGMNERFRVYRYRRGQKFAPHSDGYYQPKDRSARSMYTLLLYLSEGFEGGETVLYEGNVVVRPRTGMMLLFEHAQLHASEPIRAGEKLVVRTDVMYGRRGSAPPL